MHTMSYRIAVATLAGLVFILGWIAGAAILADLVFRLPFLIQLPYFALAGFVWVFPVRWLMLWAAHRR
jgi:hypothetical protein